MRRARLGGTCFSPCSTGSSHNSKSDKKNYWHRELVSFQDHIARTWWSSLWHGEHSPSEQSKSRRRRQKHFFFCLLKCFVCHTTNLSSSIYHPMLSLMSRWWFLSRWQCAFYSWKSFESVAPWMSSRENECVRYLSPHDCLLFLFALEAHKPLAVIALP
jgi:hypothetical protein